MMGPRTLLPIAVAVLVLVCASLLTSPATAALVAVAAVGGALVATTAIWHAVPVIMRPVVRAELRRRLER